MHLHAALMAFLPGLSCICTPGVQRPTGCPGGAEKGSPGKAVRYWRPHFVYNTPVEPQIGRQLCVIELCEEAGGRGSWGVQLADGLRLMKWIMRGARAGFHAKKRRKKTERETDLHITCSGLACSGACSPPRGQGHAWASASFPGILLGEFRL